MYPCREENLFATHRLFVIYLREIFIPGDGRINEHGRCLVSDAIFNWISANQSMFES